MIDKGWNWMRSDRRANITLDSEIMSTLIVDGNMTWSPVHEGVVHLLRIEDHVGPRDSCEPHHQWHEWRGAKWEHGRARGAGQLVPRTRRRGLSLVLVGSTVLGGLEIDDEGSGP